jgi:glyoxylase-like metal-dependent hydrolase (beta-lactamase superfamily II)
MNRIMDGVFRVTGTLLGRVYVLVNDDGLTVIDAGLRLAAAQVIRQVQAQGYSPGDIRRILVTHAHPDHVGGLPALKAATGAAVYASAVEQPLVEGKAPILRSGGRASKAMRGTPVDHTLEDGETIPGTGGLAAVLTPGHTPGHLCYWDAARKLVFCGDVMMHLVGLTLPFAAFTPNMAENIRSIARVAALEPEIVCFGHGPELARDAAEAIRRFAARAAEQASRPPQ